MNKQTFILLFAFTLIMVSCKKNLQETPTPEPTAIKATKVSELKASENFNWQTSKTILLNVAGLNTLTPISRTFIVSSMDGKIVYYQSLQLMSLTTAIKLVVPATLTEVKVSYGKINKTIAVSGNTIQFDYNKTN